jgi:hypothetical protein
LDPFDREMLQLGYLKGTHYVQVARVAEGHNERLPALAEELVRLKVDVIFAATTNAVRPRPEGDFDTDRIRVGLRSGRFRSGNQPRPPRRATSQTSPTSSATCRASGSSFSS